MTAPGGRPAGSSGCHGQQDCAWLCSVLRTPQDTAISRNMHGSGAVLCTHTGPARHHVLCCTPLPSVLHAATILHTVTIPLPCSHTCSSVQLPLSSSADASAAICASAARCWASASAAVMSEEACVQSKQHKKGKICFPAAVLDLWHAGHTACWIVWHPGHACRCAHSLWRHGWPKQQQRACQGQAPYESSSTPGCGSPALLPPGHAPAALQPQPPHARLPTAAPCQLAAGAGAPAQPGTARVPPSHAKRVAGVAGVRW